MVGTLKSGFSSKNVGLAAVSVREHLLIASPQNSRQKLFVLPHTSTISLRFHREQEMGIKKSVSYSRRLHQNL